MAKRKSNNKSTSNNNAKSNNKSNPPREGKPLRLLEPIHARAAGIDVGHAEHYVCVGEDPTQDVRRFGSFTDDLNRLADWLIEHDITTVAMESTGVYWIPLFELLEARGFEVILVDPRQTAQRAGRPKTDVLDCQWIRRLHTFGLLTGSFRPHEMICELRAYLRQRLDCVTECGRQIQHMQKALDQMNLKLHLVVSDITGVTGLAIIKAMLAGERDPQELAKLRDRRCGHDEATIALALEGTWKAEHLFVLGQSLANWEFFQQQLTRCDRQLEACLEKFPQHEKTRQLDERKRRRGRKPNEPDFDVRTLLARMAGVDLTAIEGIDQTIALTILAEIGPDLSAFATEKHFGSWLGLSPNPKKSGKHLSKSATKPSANRAARALRLAAQALSRSQSALGMFYRRMRSRIGAPKAITATAYKLARIIYRMLTRGEAYVARGMEEEEARHKAKSVEILKRKALQLGFQLVPAPKS